MGWKRLALGLGILMAWACGLVVYSAYRVTAQSSAEYPQRQTMVEAEELLAAYFAEHEQYPETLESLAFTYRYGGDETTLAQLQYFTDGAYYRIVAESPWDGSELSVCR